MVSEKYVDKVVERYAKKAVEAPKTESVTQFTYPGWDQFLSELVAKSPEDILNESSASLKSEFDKMIAPHSPLTPEAAASSGVAFETSTNIAYGAMVALVTAAEALGFGQIETPAMMLPNAPIVRAAVDAAASIRKAYLDASILKGVGYYANAQHQPTIIPQSVLVDAFNMGLIDEALYSGQMMYHGYTVERSSLISRTGVRMPDVSMILDMRRRGILTDQGAVDWMVLNKIPKDAAQSIVKLWEQFPEPSLLAQAAAKDLIGPDYYASLMSNFGIGKQFAELWREAAQQRPDVGTLFELYWRKIIDAETLRVQLIRLGFKAEDADRIKSLSEQIPPAPDLIQMVVREAFDPKMVTPAPSVFAEYMEKKGYSKEWADRYWTAHWIPIPLTQAYANVWRGYWNEEDFKYALKIADFHPSWHDPIWRVAYLPPSMRELGYGYDTGVMDKDFIREMMKWMGRDPAVLDKCVDAFVAYRTSAEVEAVRREWLSLFAREKITEEQFRSELKNLKTSPEAVELWVKRGALQKERLKKPEPEREYRIVTSTEALWAFQHGIRDEAWTRAHLEALDWTKERIDLAVESAKSVQKQPSLSDLRFAWKLGAIDDSEFVSKCRDLGYGDYASFVAEIQMRIALESEAEDLRQEALKDFVEGLIDEETLRSNLKDALTPESLIDFYVDKARYRMERDKKLTQMRMLKDQAIKGRIDTSELRSKLGLLGVKAWKINEIEEEVTLRRKSDPELIQTLTVAQVLQAYRTGIRDEKWTRKQLIMRNYLYEDIDVLLELNKPKGAGGGAETELD